MEPLAAERFSNSRQAETPLASADASGVFMPSPLATSSSNFRPAILFPLFPEFFRARCAPGSTGSKSWEHRSGLFRG
jgi:hypothetical protein